MSTTMITWQISGKELISFLNAQNNKTYKSNAFYLNASNASAKFMLECYCNRMNKREEGSVDLLLKILRLPADASDITLRYSLQCVETNTLFTKIKTFNDEVTNSCWPYNTLQLSELTKLNVITFVCDLQILSIKYNRTIYYTNYFNCMNIKMTKYTSFTWNIHNIEYNNFMNCKCGKQINSPLFGGSDIHKFFQLECYPNGIKLDQKGNVIMGLSLLLLPPLISSIELFYSFECIQCNKEWNNVHNFNYNQSVKGWPIGLITRDLLHKMTNKNKNITFKCNIEILKLYNNHNQEIHQKYWPRFIIDKTNHNNNTSCIRNNNHSQSEYDEKDVQIAKLTQNIINLQHTVDMVRKELYSIQKQNISRPKLQMSHNDRNTLDNRIHNANINHKHSHNHFAPHMHGLPPLNGQPAYNNYNNHYIQQPKPPNQTNTTYNHFEYTENRSERHEHRGLYSYNNSHHENDEIDYNIGHSGHISQNNMSNNNKYKNNPMSPFVDTDIQNDYKYQNPYQQRNEEFVEINDLVNKDVIQQMETNYNPYNINNPFFIDINNDNSSIPTNESTEDDITDSQSQDDNKQQIIKSDDTDLALSLLSLTTKIPQRMREENKDLYDDYFQDKKLALLLQSLVENINYEFVPNGLLTYLQFIEFIDSLQIYNYDEYVLKHMFRYIYTNELPQTLPPPPMIEFNNNNVDGMYVAYSECIGYEYDEILKLVKELKVNVNGGNVFDDLLTTMVLERLQNSYQTLKFDGLVAHTNTVNNKLNDDELKDIVFNFFDDTNINVTHNDESHKLEQNNTLKTKHQRTQSPNTDIETHFQTISIIGKSFTGSLVGSRVGSVAGSMSDNEFGNDMHSRIVKESNSSGQVPVVDEYDLLETIKQHQLKLKLAEEI